MTDSSILYTSTSTDPKRYNVIKTNLQPPYGDNCKLTVTNLTTKATFVVLNENDYITINNVRCCFQDKYSEMPIDAVVSVLNDLWTSPAVQSALGDTKITAANDNIGRLILTSNTPFTISNMSYNVKMITGFYNDSLPRTSSVAQSAFSSTHNTITASSVGFSLLTPILYLVSNLGAKCYDNIDELYCDRKVLMRVSNSFSSSYPIVNSNTEFSSVIPVNSLSNIEFRLVDANMHDVKLLTPMYISVQTDSLEGDSSDH